MSVACRSILPAPAYPNIIFRAYLAPFSFLCYLLFMCVFLSIVELFIYVFLRLPLLFRFSIVGVVSFILCVCRSRSAFVDVLLCFDAWPGPVRSCYLYWSLFLFPCLQWFFHASAPLFLTTVLVTELSVPTGTLHATGQLLRLPGSNPTKLTSLNCSRKPTSLPTMRHGTLTCTTVASAMWDTVVQVARWLSAPRQLIPVMTSA